MEAVVASLSGANQRAQITTEPMNTAAQPMPMRARPTVSMTGLSAPANSREPATANNSMTAMVRRAPKRSSRMPSGIWVSPKARKKAPVSSPRDSGEKPMSRTRSGAMTAVEERKNWLTI